jgi:hypothetical protein
MAVGRARGREVIVSGSDDHTVRIWDALLNDAPLEQVAKFRAVARALDGEQ